MDILLKEKGGWSNFNTTNFPDVKVELREKITNDEDFNNFLKSWEEIYDGQKYFTLDFNTEKVGMVHMKYAYRMKSFIRMLKKDKPRLLTASYIRASSSWVRFLLRFIFMFEKPVAPVYIHDFNEVDLENLKQSIKHKDPLPRGVTVFNP